MFSRNGISRTVAVAALSFALAGCSSLGQLGSILGGAGGANQVDGTIQSVDTRALTITIRQSNGQSVALNYDNQTQVTYNNQNYAVTNLEYGDQVTARVQQTQNGAYYTDLVTVNQSVSGNTSNTSSQQFQGYVQQVDQTNGWFTLQPTTNVTLTVSLPYNVNSTDLSKFRNLRSGDYVRFYGVYLNNSRVELRQFY
jgi:ribosome maturation factor RimP